jgi:hypothetical protein
MSYFTEILCHEIMLKISLVLPFPRKSHAIINKMFLFVIGILCHEIPAARDEKPEGADRTGSALLHAPNL